MASPFPGMDPYLEDPALWPNIHGRLIVAIADALSSQILPKYQPIIEESAYRIRGNSSVMVGIPDVAVQKTDRIPDNPSEVDGTAALAPPVPVTAPVGLRLPMPQTVRQRRLEIRNSSNQEVVTVIEVLSPVNKRPGEGRQQYERKRERLLESDANLVEIDLLHKGEPMPVTEQQGNSHYRILVSPVSQRPQALLYPFNLPQPLPRIEIPLREGDPLPILDFQQLLQEIYQRSGYKYSIDYSQSPQPGWPNSEQRWIEQHKK